MRFGDISLGRSRNAINATLLIASSCHDFPTPHRNFLRKSSYLVNSRKLTRHCPIGGDPKQCTGHGCRGSGSRPTILLSFLLVRQLTWANLHAEHHNNQESGRAGQGMKAWTMVANTDSLLDDESMKSIMLLKGIKGTHLFIPRIGKLRENIICLIIITVWS